MHDRTYATLDAFKKANEEAGQHFFSPETMRFFDSRIETDMIDHYFVTSEQFHGSTESGPRLFTVREALADATVETHGFQQHTTLDDALHAIAMLVAQRLGHEAGVAAGSWLIDGNSSEADAKRLLDGIEDGDPEILDRLPSAPLSGEWADGPTPDDVVREIESEVEVVVDEDSRDDVLRSYEDGFSEGVEEEAVRSARAMLGEGVSA